MSDYSGLVISGTTAIHASIHDGGLEFWGLPDGGIAWRLDIVVGVEQDLRGTVLGGSAGDHGGSTKLVTVFGCYRGAANLNEVKNTGFGQEIGYGLSALDQVFWVESVPSDARDTNQISERANGRWESRGSRIGDLINLRLRKRVACCHTGNLISQGRARTPSKEAKMSDSTPEQKPAGKGKATPTRKQAESANIRPLVGDRSPEARAAQKAKAKADRERMRAGQLAGDDRYLPIRERGPQKKFVRDLIDARYTIGEFLIPAMVMILLLSFFDSNQASTYNKVLSAASIGIMLAILIDSIFIARRIKRKAAEKFGADKLESGLAFYGIVRATQLRVMRMPKPQVGPFLNKQK